MPYENVPVGVFRREFNCKTCGTPVKVVKDRLGYIYDGTGGKQTIKHQCPNPKCQHTFWLPEVMPKIVYVDQD